ncbi:MAG TPA: hypothetical protein VFQ76_09210 [Longimicrobiaceae bacterium]|nr:hypothetical protein [Longimicrobiaceae bacterium]
MARYRCPACRRRIPGDQRCHRCGWLRVGESGAPPVARPPWGRMMAVLTIVLALAAAGVYRTSGAAIADWYAEFALNNLPAGFTSFAPADTPSGAFSHCVSRVVKKVSDGSSVETFPSYSAENTVAMGDGRYTVQAVLEGVTVDGETTRRPFSCVVRFQGGRWVTEKLAVGDLPDLLPIAALRL